MSWSYRLMAVALLLGGTLGCNTGPRSAMGFRLPDGDAERGKRAFLALECHRCHDAAGVALPRTDAQPAAPIRLGGPTTRTITDGYLVTSIINPGHAMAPGARERIRSGSIPVMPDYSDRVTGRDLEDLAAFLHPLYTEAARVPNPAYY